MVRLPLHKNLVALYLGLQPESLSRALAKLREYGVRTVPDGIEISDPDALIAMVGNSFQTHAHPPTAAAPV